MSAIQPHEEQYCLSAQNLEYAHQMADAIIARDEEKMAEIERKMILPLARLKTLGKEYIHENGVPTICAEIVNDTDWLT